MAPTTGGWSDGSSWHNNGLILNGSQMMTSPSHRGFECFEFVADFRATGGPCCVFEAGFCWERKMDPENARGNQKIHVWTMPILKNLKHIKMVKKFSHGYLG